MKAQAAEHHTYEATDEGALAHVHDFLAAHTAAGRGAVVPQYFLSGAAAGDQVELPAEVHAILLQVVEALRAGLAVTVAPQARTLTSQQAADLLGVSRPTLVRLLEKGAIPYEKIGAHRRLQLPDVLSYRDVQKRRQYDAIAALSVDVSDDELLDDVLEDLRAARRAVRRQRT